MLSPAHIDFAHSEPLDTESGVLGELVLAVVHVEPDLPQHPLDAGVVPLPVVEARRHDGELGVAQRVLQAAVHQGQAGPADLPDLHHHQEAVALARAEGEAVEPGQGDGVEAGIVYGEPTSFEPFCLLEFLTAVLPSPALGTFADIAAPSFGALAAILIRVRHYYHYQHHYHHHNHHHHYHHHHYHHHHHHYHHYLTRMRHAELSPLRAAAQSPIVKDKVVEIGELVINLEVPDTSIQGGSCHST